MRHQHDSKLFRSVVNTARDAILVMDTDGNIILWNGAATAMFGYDADEAIGKDLHALIVPKRFRSDARQGMAVFRQNGTGKNINKTIEQYF